MLGGKSVEINRTIGASVGSKATSSAMHKATRVSKDRSTSATSSSMDRSVRLPVSGKAIHPGSKAGFKDAKSVHLNMNDTGYLNPANQNARLKNRTRQVNISVDNRVSSRRSTNRTYDSRLTCSSTSSISRMNKKSAR